MPRWLGQIYDLDLPEHFTTLIRVLQDQSRKKRVAMMAPEPPADFVPRPGEFGALKQKLLDAKGDVVAHPVALKGAGGYGKTTLAKALAHDPDIQDAYVDGVLWVELARSPTTCSPSSPTSLRFSPARRRGLRPSPPPPLRSARRWATAAS